MKNPRMKVGVWSGLMAVALALGACGGEPSNDDLGETASATGPWYFCVDHPCPNLEAMGFSSGCPVSQGLLEVGVKNVGNLTAVPTTTNVKFFASSSKLALGDVTFEANSLVPGGQDVRWIPAPNNWVAGCSTKTCTWRVTADVGNRVGEVDETNNIKGGTCWFP